MRTLVFRKKAELEIDEAIDWYRERGLKVATAFVESVDRILQSIQLNPFQYQVIEGDIRRAFLRRFPYMIVYEVTETELIIASCFHTSRDPVSLAGRA